MDLLKLRIDTLQPDLNVGRAGRLKLSAQWTWGNIDIQLLQPQLNNLWERAGQVEAFPWPITKMQCQELTREDLQQRTSS